MVADLKAGEGMEAAPGAHMAVRATAMLSTTSNTAMAALMQLG